MYGGPMRVYIAPLPPAHSSPGAIIMNGTVLAAQLQYTISLFEVGWRLELRLQILANEFIFCSWIVCQPF